MIFYLYGDNDYAIKTQLDGIKRQYIQKTGGELELESFDMADRSPSELLDALAVMPMFVTSRLIVVYNLSANKSAAEQIEIILSAVPDSTILVIIDPKPDKRGKVFKVLKALPKATEYKKLMGSELIKWLRSMAKKLGGSLDTATANFLVAQVGNDQWQLSQELQKLVLFDPSISVDSIKQLVTPNTEQTIFELIELIAKRRQKEALQKYKHLSGSGVADQQMLAMFNWQYRNLALAKDNEGKGTDWAKQLGVSPFAASKAEALARQLEMSEIKAAYRAIVEADMAIKSGQMDSGLALERLIVQLCS